METKIVKALILVVFIRKNNNRQTTMACATSTNAGNDELDVSITEAIVQAHSMYDELYNSRQLEKMVDSIYAEDCCVMMEGRDVIRGRKGEV